MLADASPLAGISRTLEETRMEIHVREKA